MKFTVTSSRNLSLSLSCLWWLLNQVSRPFGGSQQNHNRVGQLRGRVEVPVWRRIGGGQLKEVHFPVLHDQQFGGQIVSEELRFPALVQQIVHRSVTVQERPDALHFDRKKVYDVCVRAEVLVRTDAQNVVVGLEQIQVRFCVSCS
ncbi:hypothetical protein L1887_63330 [Cichorium endivia]|nr:hypothetical protein L1887_63330 [Cichorium endivia]